MPIAHYTLVPYLRTAYNPLLLRTYLLSALLTYMSIYLYPGQAIAYLHVLTVMLLSHYTQFLSTVFPTILYLQPSYLRCFLHVYLSCTPGYPLSLLTVIPVYATSHSVLSTRTSNPLLFLLTCYLPI
jgi:hypothetical protein